MKQSNKRVEDNYAHSIDDFLKDDLRGFKMDIYVKWKYKQIASYLGNNVLEVGSGDRSFANYIVQNTPQISRLVSIEPSPLLFNSYGNKIHFPDYVQFHQLDFNDKQVESFAPFDTILLSHVLEHIEDDRSFLSRAFDLLSPHGKVLVMVPAMPSLFSDYDKALGHIRRYNKRMLLECIDGERYLLKDIWYGDPLGILGFITPCK